jgi:ABC-2 type transport system permease protein
VINQQSIKNATSAQIYDSARQGFAPLEEFNEIWRYRNMIVQLVQRDIVSRYKRSVLGVAWTMLNPLGMMIVLSIVFSQIFHAVESYPAYLLSGYIAWTFFAQSTSAAINALVWGGDFFRRIYVPRSIFAIAAVGTGLVNLVLSLVPLFIVMLATGVPIRWTIIFLPIPILLLTCFALAIGLFISTAGIYFPDVVEMYHVALLAWFYLTAILYPVEIVPDRFRFFIDYNPAYHLIKLFRQPIYEGVIPSWELILLAAGIGIIPLLVSFWIFVKKADEFAYRT